MDDVGGAVVGTRVGLKEGLDDGMNEGCGVGAARLHVAGGAARRPTTATVAENGLMWRGAFESRASSCDGSKAGAARAAPASERTTGPAPWRGSISDSVRFPTLTTKNATVAAPRPQCAKIDK